MKSKMVIILGLVTLVSMSIVTCGGKKTAEKPSGPPAAKIDKPAEKAETKSAAPAASPKEGEKLVKAKCISCHSIDGKKAMSTSLKGLYGTERTVVTKGKERKVNADDAYLLKAIVDPTADTLKGGGIMPNMGVKDDEAKAIVEYIKTLK